jgi:CheY-like chemotaxis protein
LANDIILIVDDSKFITQSYSKILLGLGYRVRIARDGESGLVAAATCRPSLILLSMLLPDMDGAETLRDLKQAPSTRNIPVLIISSLSGKNADGLIRQGAAGFFDKGSMTPETLGNAVSGILNRTIGSTKEL